MGWSGYGIFDGDDTFSAQMTILETAGYDDDKPIPLRNGGTIEAWELDPTHVLADEVVVKVYKKYDKITRNLGVKNLLELDENTFEKKVLRLAYYEEDTLIPITMLADFFLRQGAAMPGQLQQKAILATNMLIESEHTEDFDEPYLRKRELRKHRGKFERFTPKVQYVDGELVKISKNPAKKTTLAKKSTAAKKTSAKASEPAKKTVRRKP